MDATGPPFLAISARPARASRCLPMISRGTSPPTLWRIMHCRLRRRPHSWQALSLGTARKPRSSPPRARL